MSGCDDRDCLWPLCVIEPCRNTTNTVARKGFARSFRETPAEVWAAHVASLGERDEPEPDEE